VRRQQQYTFVDGQLVPVHRTANNRSRAVSTAKQFRRVSQDSWDAMLAKLAGQSGGAVKLDRPTPPQAETPRGLGFDD
jgi:hypothetical protein